MDIPEKGHYDSTISESKEASLAKAMEIMMQDIEKNQKIQIITRPKVSLIKGLIPVLLYLCSGIALLVLAPQLCETLPLSPLLFRLLVLAVYLVIGLLCLKRLLIWMILLYQKYAPEKVRKLCYFEPSCSAYMKQAIEKYGVIRGVYKGFNRLGRCHWPNGGIDYP